VRSLVLASASPARGALLRQAGVSFETIHPGVEERLDPARPARELARELAAAKARAAFALRPDAIVVGADQVVDLDGRALGKPATAEDAARQLAALAGREHTIVTAFTVLAPGVEIHDEEVTRLAVRALTAEEIAAYVASGEWQGCAGGYRIEGLGVAIFERIDGDPTNVIGLPLPRLLGHLRALGVPLFAGGRAR
jgi:septum formation protein